MPVLTSLSLIGVAGDRAAAAMSRIVGQVRADSIGAAGDRIAARRPAPDLSGRAAVVVAALLTGWAADAVTAPVRVTASEPAGGRAAPRSRLAGRRTARPLGRAPIADPSRERPLLARRATVTVAAVLTGGAAGIAAALVRLAAPPEITALAPDLPRRAAVTEARVTGIRRALLRRGTAGFRRIRGRSRRPAANLALVAASAVHPSLTDRAAVTGVAVAIAVAADAVADPILVAAIAMETLLALIAAIRDPPVVVETPAALRAVTLARVGVEVADAARCPGAGTAARRPAGRAAVAVTPAGTGGDVGLAGRVPAAAPAVGVSRQHHLAAGSALGEAVVAELARER